MDDAGFSTPEGVVSELYALVSAAPGASPDWEAVRALFIDETVVVALENAARDTTLVMQLDAFIDFLRAFIEGEMVREYGFEEKIIRMKPVLSGNMAHILTLYESRFPGLSDPPPWRGIDSIQLVKRGSRWQIVSITNDLPAPDAPLPDALRP